MSTAAKDEYTLVIVKPDGVKKSLTGNILTKLAEARLICEQRLGSKGLAFQWAGRAFDVAPKNETVRTDLERVAGEADEWGPLAAMYAKRAEATTDAEERLWLLRRGMRINLTRLYKPLDARAFAERIVTELGHDEEADGALEQIFTQAKAEMYQSSIRSDTAFASVANYRNHLEQYSLLGDPSMTIASRRTVELAVPADRVVIEGMSGGTPAPGDTVVTVEATSAGQTCCVPWLAASCGKWPRSCSRRTFSSTMIAASSTMPTPNASPASEITLSVRPVSSSVMKVESRQIGTVRPTSSTARV